eukprot:3932121-Rhodomonas_salina.1
MPTYKYNPATRDASLIIPEPLKVACPAEDATKSFFGCTHKHILRNKVITNHTDAYLVSSSPPPKAGAQDFVESMLGEGTASVAARELGREFESYLMTSEGVTGTSTKSIGLWINPGHKWGGVTAKSDYSLSNHLIIYVLFGVRSGVDGSERRMLLQAGADGVTSLVRTLQYNVQAATLIERAMDNVIAIEVEARLAVSAEEACLPLARLREICSARLTAALAPHASKVEAVQCVAVTVENANCDGTRRSAAAPVMVVDAVIVLAQSADAFLDIDAVVASGSVLGMKQTFPVVEGTTPAPDAGDEPGSGSNSVAIGAAAGAAGVVLLIGLVGWRAWTQCRASRRASDSAPTGPLTEVVSTVVEPVSMKLRLESLLFEGQRQPHTLLFDGRRQ